MKTDGPGIAAPGQEVEWQQAWEAALAALELDVLEAEQLLATGPAETADPLPVAEPWTPPVLPGPLPSNLRSRAEAILARQLRVADDLARAMGGNRREQQVARRMDSGTVDRSQPVFVDSHF